MVLDKAITLGVAGNEISKQITGSSETSLGRTAVATTAGGVLGGVATGALVITGVAAAPVTVPLVVATAAVAGIMSLFD